MHTYTGIDVTIKDNVPSIEDMSIMLNRMCRFNGGCKIFWPVGIHSLAVADLICHKYPQYEVPALMHDAAESIRPDISCSVKTWWDEVLERRYLKRIYKVYGVPWPTKEVRDAVKSCDSRIGFAEVCLIGPPNLIDKFNGKARDIEAEDILREYLKGLQPEDMLTPNGIYVKQFEQRLKFALNKFEGKYCW